MRPARYQHQVTLLAQQLDHEDGLAVGAVNKMQLEQAFRAFGLDHTLQAGIAHILAQQKQQGRFLIHAAAQLVRDTLDPGAAPLAASSN